MNKALASTLHGAVCQRLDYVDQLIADGDLPTRAAVAESEITRLTTAWRVLLAQHQPDRDGRCARCRRWWRRRPCSVWTTAHHHLITADPLPVTARVSP